MVVLLKMYAIVSFFVLANNSLDIKTLLPVVKTCKTGDRIAALCYDDLEKKKKNAVIHDKGE